MTVVKSVFADLQVTIPSRNRFGGMFFVAGALVIACGAIGYFVVENAARRDRPAAFVPAEPPTAPAPARQ